MSMNTVEFVLCVRDKSKKKTHMYIRDDRSQLHIECQILNLTVDPFTFARVS